MEESISPDIPEYPDVDLESPPLPEPPPTSSRPPSIRINPESHTETHAQSTPTSPRTPRSPASAPTRAAPAAPTTAPASEPAPAPPTPPGSSPTSCAKSQQPQPQQQTQLQQPQQQQAQQQQQSQQQQAQQQQLEFSLIKELKKRSKDFYDHINNPIFNTLDNRIEKLLLSSKYKYQEVERMATETCPVFDSQVFGLVSAFLRHKRTHGTRCERHMYANMSCETLIVRLLTLRPIVFYTADDVYVLPSLAKGKGGFEAIQDNPEILKTLISYDEMCISALLTMFVPTYFINSGSRTNNGIKQPHSTSAPTYEKRGIMVGMVGARFEKPGMYMESRFMIVHANYSTVENGYGPSAFHSSPHTPSPGTGTQSPAAANTHTAKAADFLRLWAEFYGVTYFPTYDEVAELESRDHETFSKYFVRIAEKEYFNVVVYKRRMRMIVAPFLREANARARELNVTACCVCVGLGMGVWLRFDEQQTYLLDVYAELLSSPEEYTHISDLCFNYLGDEFTHSQRFADILASSTSTTKSHIRVRFMRDDPIMYVGPDKLLVVQYAWDGNR
jgi:flagellar motor protein MotB